MSSAPSNAPAAPDLDANDLNDPASAPRAPTRRKKLRPALDRAVEAVPRADDGDPSRPNSPVTSNAAPPDRQGSLARIARRTRETVQDVGEHAQQQLLKQLAASGHLRPTFVDHGSQFRDKVMEAMPGLAQRLIDFLGAAPTYSFNNAGNPVLVVPEEFALTEPQIRLLQSVLDKFVPQQKPMDLSGDQKTQGGTRKVSIHVATVGNAPEYSKLPGGSDGIAGAGEAKQITTITFDKAGSEPIITQESG